MQMVDEISPAAAAYVGGRMPAQSQIGWLSIAPIAESRSSYNGFLVLAFISSLVFSRIEKWAKRSEVAR